MHYLYKGIKKNNYIIISYFSFKVRFKNKVYTLFIRLGSSYYSN
jgi:hypothetical protein